jgi:hypothetical protein
VLDLQLRIVNVGDIELRRILKRQSFPRTTKRRKASGETVDYEAYLGESLKPMTVREYRGTALRVRDALKGLEK